MRFSLPVFCLFLMFPALSIAEISGGFKSADNSESQTSRPVIKYSNSRSEHFTETEAREKSISANRGLTMDNVVGKSGAFRNYKPGVIASLPDNKNFGLPARNNSFNNGDVSVAKNPSLPPAPRTSFPAAANDLPDASEPRTAGSNYDALAKISPLDPHVDVNASGCKKQGCKRIFRYQENGVDFMVGCAKVIMKHYEHANQPVVISEDNYNSCYCTVHSSKGPAANISVPEYAKKFGHHYYAFPISPDDKYVDEEGKACSAPGEFS